jgi:hypothetical protein
VSPGGPEGCSNNSKKRKRKRKRRRRKRKRKRKKRKTRMTKVMNLPKAAILTKTKKTDRHSVHP